MTADRLDAAARRIYETLASKGHGPRPWAPQGALTPPWEQLPEAMKNEYRAAAEAAMQAEGQERMIL